MSTERTLGELPADAPVTVVGAGPTGLGTATEPAERGRAVRLGAGGTTHP